MTAPSEITAAISGVFGLIDRLELYVNRYYERKDLTASNADLHSRLQEEHEMALEYIQMLEESNDIDNTPLCNSIIHNRLSVMRSRLQANTEKLKALSHAISNASVMDRVRRTNTVLEESRKDVADFLSLLMGTVIPSLRQNTLEEMTSSETYQPGNNVPPNPPRLTLDYDSTDTCEGRLKQAILEGSKSRVVAVMASGPGGVGKTCALRGLAKDSEITQRFTGGILYIRLRNSASIPDIINEIGRAVELTGGERLARTIRGLRRLQDAADKAARWFKPHRCLFLIDDIWQVNGITSDVFTVLDSMLHKEGLLVYATRDKRLQGGAHKIVPFLSREAHGGLAQRMFMTHIGFESDIKLSSVNREAFNGILDICNGLPLGIGIAGATVLKYSGNREVNKQSALADFYHDLKSKEESIVMEGAEQYGSLRLVVDSSLEVLDSENRNKATFEGMFRALCVLPKQQSVSGQVLQKVWSLSGLRETREIAESFDKVSIVQLTRECGNRFCIQLHDLVLDIAMRKASEKNEVKAWFKGLVDNYMPKGETTTAGAEVTTINDKVSSASAARIGVAKLFRKCFCVTTDDSELEAAQKEEKILCTPWWNVEDDGFIRENLLRILEGAGKTKELSWLLERAQWIVTRLQTGGIHGVEQDLRIGEQTAPKTNDQVEFIRYLKLVGSAARMSCVAVANNAHEAWFQLYGRLERHSNNCGRVRRFVSEINDQAPRPWLKPSIGFLADAGGAALETIRFEHSIKVLCISHGGSFIRTLWNDKNGAAYVTQYDKIYASRETLRLRSNALHKNYGVDHRICKSWLSPTERCTFGAFSSNLEWLVTAYTEGRVLVWDVGSGYKLEKCFKSPHAVTCIGISGDGRTIASGSWCNGVRTWSVKSEAFGIPLEGLEVDRPVRHIAVSFDGNRIVCTSDSSLKGDAHVWDRGIGDILQLPREIREDDVSCVTISEDGGRVVTGSSEGVIRIWDIDDTGSVLTMKCETSKLGCLAFSGDGRIIISSSSGGDIGVWDAKTGRQIGEPLERPRKHGVAIAVNANGRELVAALSSSTLRVWDVENMDSLDPPERLTNQVHSVAYHGHGMRVISGSDDGCVRLWDTESGEMIGKPLKGHKSAADFVRISGNGNRILSGSWDGKVLVWDANHGELVGRLYLRVEITSEGVDNDGKRMVCSSRAGIHVWDVDSGEVALHVAGDTSFAACVGISSDGTRVAFSSRYNSLILWDVDKREAVGRPLEGHKKNLRSVAWSDDGKRIVSGSDDCTVRVWNVATGNAVGEAFVHECEVVHVESDAHCLRVVSYDKKGYGRVWDVARRQCIMKSSESTWSSTLHRYGLARFHCRMLGTSYTEMMVLDAEHEQVMAYLDKKAVRVGDIYFSDMHSSTFWPFSRIVW